MRTVWRWSTVILEREIAKDRVEESEGVSECRGREGLRKEMIPERRAWSGAMAAKRAVSIATGPPRQGFIIIKVRRWPNAISVIFL
jgi:hypothetical protein